MNKDLLWQEIKGKSIITAMLSIRRGSKIMPKYYYEEGDMKILGKAGGVFLSAVISLFFLYGCTLKVPVTNPVPSTFSYAGAPDVNVKVQVKDKRPQGSMPFSHGRISVLLLNFEEIAFFSKALVEELKARGINAKLAETGEIGSDILTLEVERFFMRNYRATGYSPFITFTNLRSKNSYKGKEVVIAAYYHAGKVPFWSMKEINEPNYNYPLSIIVKEVATKLNNKYFHLPPPENTVKAKLDAIKNIPEPDCNSIVELGILGSNSALPYLESLVKEGQSGNVVTCALNAIGIIGSPQSLGFLKDYYSKSESKGQLWALKAIGDIGTPEAIQFLKNQPGDIHYNLREIIEAYTQ